MPPKSLFVLLLGALYFGWAQPASADLVIITAGGTLQHLQNPAGAPSLVRNAPTVSITFLLDRAQPPIATDAQSATYRPVSATLRIGEATIPLREATFLVQRYTGDPFGPIYGYLMRGVTETGWFFSLGMGSTSPMYAPDFGIPTERPEGDLDIAHDLTLRNGTEGWDAYGDADIWAITPMS